MAPPGEGTGIRSGRALGLGGPDVPFPTSAAVEVGPAGGFGTESGPVLFPHANMPTQQRESTREPCNLATFDRRTAAGYSVPVQSEAPPQTPPSEPREPRADGDRERRRLERILPELIKRLLETGLEKLADAPEKAQHLVSELRVPKEFLALLFAQFEETKNGLYRVVAREVRDFLEHTNFADELARVLTTLSFEIKTEVRFIPNDSRLGASPDVRARARVKRSDRTSVPPSPPSSPDPPPSGEPQ